MFVAIHRSISYCVWHCEGERVGERATEIALPCSRFCCNAELACASCAVALPPLLVPIISYTVAVFVHTITISSDKTDAQSSCWCGCRFRQTCACCKLGCHRLNMERLRAGASRYRLTSRPTASLQWFVYSNTMQPHIQDQHKQIWGFCIL